MPEAREPVVSGSSRTCGRGVAVMVCGTTSGAGKSFLATALARWYARQGLKVAPFKAQNMSNNARVVADGEMASAQYFQALAARTTPQVRMNPVLLKPERDTHSQVIVLGRRDDRIAAMEWRSRCAMLWPLVRDCLLGLLSEHDVLVIEGAGSPAEINLHATDIVNMRVARTAAAATLLVADIDRGGAFAHLYGTHQLLPPEERALIRGFVLNKFRGDARLLAPGPQRLEELTGVPTLGVLPLWRAHGLPEEDGVNECSTAGGAGPRIAIVSYPHISNLDEFAPLRRIAGARIAWARTDDAIAETDLLILPGSKHVAADLEWLRAHRLDHAVAAHVRANRPTLAVCGGLQMLGHAIADPQGVEGAAQGLGLLPYSTEFAPLKRYAHGSYTLAALEDYWRPLSGLELQGYEIRHGHTRALGDRATPAALHPVLPDHTGWQSGAVLALYVHGLFENSAVMRALFGQQTPTLEDTLDGLADFLEEHIAEERLRALLDDAGARR